MSDIGDRNIFLRFGDRLDAAARARAEETAAAESELRFALDYLVPVRCAVAAAAAHLLSSEQTEDVAAFLDSQADITIGRIQDASGTDEIEDAVMAGSDGMHSFLLAHDLLEPYSAFVDAEEAFLDLLVYGRDDWRTEHSAAARERGRAERVARHAGR